MFSYSHVVMFACAHVRMFSGYHVLMFACSHVLMFAECVRIFSCSQIIAGDVLMLACSQGLLGEGAEAEHAEQDESFPLGVGAESNERALRQALRMVSPEQRVRYEQRIFFFFFQFRF